MADKTTSWLLDNGLLGMVPQDQAESAANQANWSFWLNLLGSGNPGTAYNAAQTAGYNTINHAIQLQQHQMQLGEAARKAAETKILRDAAAGAVETLPGVGTSDPRFLPRNDAGEIVPGPGYIPPRQVFNYEKYKSNPNLPRALTPDQLKNMYAPNLTNVNGRLVDLSDISNRERYVPNMPTGLDENGLPVGNVVAGVAALEGAKEKAKADYDTFMVDMGNGIQIPIPKSAIAEAYRSGKPIVNKTSPKVGENMELYTDLKTGMLSMRPIKGATKAVGALEGAKANAQESAKAAYDIQPVQTPDGTTLLPTRAQVINAAKGGQPLVQNIGPQAKAEREGAGKFNIDQVLTPAKQASEAAGKSNQNLAILSQTLKSTPLNQITASDTVQRLAGYAKASGILTEDAAKNVSNLSALRGLISGSVLQEQLAQKGPQTESDAKRMTETVTAMGDKDATQFLINAKMAQNKRTQEYYNHLDQYRRTNGTLDGADEAWGKGKGGQSIFRAPEMKQYAPIYEYNGKRYRVFGDGGAPELVK